MKKIVFVITIFLTSITYADTLLLIDNTLLSGKIVKKKKSEIIFANKSGSFKIKQKFIKNAYRTSSYHEDVIIHQKFESGKHAETIRKDYEMGMKLKRRLIKIYGKDFEGNIARVRKNRKSMKRDPMGYFGDWTYGRLIFSMTYFTTLLSEFSITKNVNEVLPSGISVSLAYDQGLEFKKRSMYIPGLRLQHSYFYFTQSLFQNDIKEIMGHDINLGLVWALPGLNSTKGYFTVFLLPGASIIFINNRKTHRKVRTATFSIKTGMGYEIRYKKVTFMFNFNYNYMVDYKVSFNSIGGSFGMAFKLW